MSKDLLAYAYYDSAIGPLLVAGDRGQLNFISFSTGSRTKKPLDHWVKDENVFKSFFAQLDAYFNGELKAFDVDFVLSGTDFQNTVWRALCDIPYGETWSYGSLAQYIGRPNASRAVGAANGANPLPILLPCHRVIGADKSLTGFGGGMKTKQFLLCHEGAIETQPALF